MTKRKPSLASDSKTMKSSGHSCQQSRRGRPTKYKPEFCEVVLDVGEQGGWLAEMAEACDVSRPLMDNWAERHPEFLEALSRAKQKAQAWFERQGRLGLTAPKFNSSLWMKQMSARHPNEYTDRKERSVEDPLQALLKGMKCSSFPVAAPGSLDEQDD